MFAGIGARLRESAPEPSSRDWELSRDQSWASASRKAKFVGKPVKLCKPRRKPARALGSGFIPRTADATGRRQIRKLFGFGHSRSKRKNSVAFERLDRP